MEHGIGKKGIKGDVLALILGDQLRCNGHQNLVEFGPHTWEAAQLQLQSNAKFSGRNQRRQYLLSRLLRCGISGGAYTGSGNVKRGKEYRYYSCSVRDPLT